MTYNHAGIDHEIVRLPGFARHHAGNHHPRSTATRHAGMNAGINHPRRAFARHHAGNHHPRSAATRHHAGINPRATRCKPGEPGCEEKGLLSARFTGLWGFASPAFERRAGMNAFARHAGMNAEINHPRSAFARQHAGNHHPRSGASCHHAGINPRATQCKPGEPGCEEMGLLSARFTGLGGFASPAFERRAGMNTPTRHAGTNAPTRHIWGHHAN